MTVVTSVARCRPPGAEWRAPCGARGAYDLAHPPGAIGSVAGLDLGSRPPRGTPPPVPLAPVPGPARSPGQPPPFGGVCSVRAPMSNPCLWSAQWARA